LVFESNFVVFSSFHIKNFSYQTNVHSTPWFIGIITAFIKQKGDVNLSKSQIKILWIISSLSIVVLAQRHVFVQDRVFDAFYETIKRIVWGLNIAWTIFACHHLNSGGAYKRFLGHSFWQPLARLGLGVYLTHFIYIYMTVVNMKQTSNFGFFWVIHIIFGDILVAIFLGAVMFMLVESPTLEITKFLENRFLK
jgi:hypothetical protein